MNLSEIDPKTFVPMGHNRKAILAERIGEKSPLIVPDTACDPRMSSGLEPPELSHWRPKYMKILAIGPKVTGVRPGDVVCVPGAGNCYPDLEDGVGAGSRVLIREGDIAGTFEAIGHERFPEPIAACICPRCSVLRQSQYEAAS